MGAAYRCEVCDEHPHWRADRRGDAAVSWACDDDLIRVLRRMQRDFERTALVVTRHVRAEVAA